MVAKAKTFLSLKNQRRLWTVVKNSLHSLALPIFSIIISYLVIKLASVERWGEFVNVMILVQLAAHVMGWGNKEYLLREFSRNPSQIALAWQSTLATRFLLLLPFGIVLAWGEFSAVLCFWMFLWGIGQVYYQSFDVFVVYKRDFLFAMLVETVTLLLMGLCIWGWGEQVTIVQLAALFAIAQLVKGGVMSGRFGRFAFTASRFRLHLPFFKLALPFFLLGLTGMLQSRIDLYSVNYFLDERSVGQYQVFINLMIYVQSISAFVLVPFIKSIYRLSNTAVLRLSARLFMLGCAIILPALAATYLVITRVYGFELSGWMLVAGGLFVLPIYFYLPIIYVLYKTDVQWMVIWVNLFGLAVNFGLNIWFVPRLGGLGAMIGSAVAQWVMLAVYLWQSRVISRQEYDESNITLPELP